MESRLAEKNWSKEIEKQIYTEWKETKRYKFDRSTKKKVYAIDTPPPYVNAPIHIGHATVYTLNDMFARYKRMTGYEVLFPLGLDRNGLPIEMAAEKKFNIKFNNMPRIQFLEFCNKVLEDSSMASVESFLRLGISFNSWEKGNELGDVYETDSPEYRRLTQDTFIEMWDKGLIFEDNRTNNWCPGCQTTIADAEIEYEELSSFFNDIKFKIKETGEDIIIGTTRPELICTCEMICYNPDDERYMHLEGKHAITPIFNKIVPIKPDRVAQLDKGTGLMMMCSFGDVTDIRFFRDNGLKPIIAINKDGTMNEHAKFLQGLSTKDAQKKLVLALSEQNLLVKQQKIKHRTPICARSKHAIEFIDMKELYLRQMDFKEEIHKIAHKLKFYAPESKRILSDWIDSVSIDWPISRRRYYATEIPLWYCKKCNTPVLPKKGRYHQPWKEPCPIDKCPKCQHTEFYGEERVLDTWFDSSISPLYIMKYGDLEFKDFFETHSPCTLRPQGREIIRTWLYYTLLRVFLLTGEPAFEDVWINYYVIDETGRKMSKSAGNGVDPQDVLDKFGAETFRLWTAIEGNIEKSDFRCSYERIEGAGKTISKLWNVAKFISMFDSQKKFSEIENHLTDLDKWVLNETNMLVIRANDKYEKYDFHSPAVDIRHFIWEVFASNYIELVKNRAYNSNKEFTIEQEDAAKYVLNYVLDTLLKLLAPILPFITYKIYKEFRQKDIHSEAFPKPGKEFEEKFTKEDIIELNSFIWKAKKEKGLSLRDEVKKLTIEHKFKEIQHDLISAHNIKHLALGTREIEL